MFYNDFTFLLMFLPLMLIAYQVTARKHRSKTLLFFNLVFYFLLSEFLIIFLFIIAFTTYFAGRMIEKTNKKENKKKLLLLGLMVPLLFLLWFKYYNFIGVNFNKILFYFQSSLTFPHIKIIQPIGISFFSLQAISYLIDVKNRKYEAEKNPLNVLIYLSFIPTVIEGPIARYDTLMPDIKKNAPISYTDLCFGAQRILWGLIKKMVVADRIDPFVKLVFKNVETNTGGVLLLAVLLYTLQLYAEFSGTMDVVLGIAEILGIKLTENFNQPFFSKSVSEFWRRWHISLGAFFKDYIFYPISLSKKTRKLSKKLGQRLSKYYSRMIPSLFALFFVWLANGLWHGAQWQYILYGMYYFVLITLGILFEPLFLKFYKKTKIHRESRMLNIFRWIRTFVLVNIGMLIFRSHGVRMALRMLKKIVITFNVSDFLDQSLFNKGLDIYDFSIILVGLFLMILVGMIKERKIHIRETIANYHWAVRVAFYYAAMLFLIIFGAYGYGYALVELIYANF